MPKVFDVFLDKRGAKLLILHEIMDKSAAMKLIAAIFILTYNNRI